MKKLKPSSVFIQLLTYLVVLSGIATSCVTRKVVQITQSQWPDPQRKVTMAIYTRQKLEIKIFNAGMTQYGAIGGLATGLMNEQKVENGVKAKKGAYEYGKLVGFDVLTFFDTTFRKKANSLRYFKAIVADSMQTVESVAERFAYVPEEVDTVISKEHLQNKTPYIGAIKLKYGIRMYDKRYKPYVMIVGGIRHTATDKLLWQNQIIVMSQNLKMKGVDGIKEVDPTVLISTYKDLCEILAQRLINSLNGEVVENPERFLDGTSEDFDY